MNYQFEETQQLNSSHLENQAQMNPQENLNKIYEWLRGGQEELKQLIRSVTFFRKGEDPILQAKYNSKIEECLKYHFVPQNSFLFHHEQDSDNFYIILKGKCQVLIPKKQNEIKQEIVYLKEMQHIQTKIKQYQDEKEFYTASIQQQKQNQVQKKLSELRSEQLIQAVKEQSRPIKEIYISHVNKNICKYKVALTLYQGDYFGESAFSGMPKRNGSIFVNEDTHFAFLNREDFLRIFQNEIINQSVSKQQLTKLFPHLNNKKIDILNSFVEDIELVKNQVVFSQNQKSDGFIYIVQKGEFEVKFNLNQSKSIIKNVSNNLIEEQLLRYNKQLEIPLLSLLEGEIFGIEDIQKEQKSFSVLCSSVKGNLFRFRMALLQQLEDNESLKIIKQLGQQRFERIQKKIEQKIIQNKNVLSVQKIDNLRNSFTQTQSQNNMLKRMERCNTTISPTQKPLSKGNNVNKSFLNIQEARQGEYQDQNSIYLSTQEDSDLIDDMLNFKQQSYRYDISMRIRAQKFKRYSIRKEDNQQKDQIYYEKSKSPEIKGLNTINSQNQFNNSYNNLLSDYLFNVPLNIKKDKSNDNESPEQRNQKLEVLRSYQKSRTFINSSQTISPLRITSVQLVRDGSQCSEMYVSKSQQKSTSITPIKQTQPEISQFSPNHGQQELQLKTPKRVHPKQMFEQQKIKPMHKNHFSIFTREHFDDMCVKSDLKPSLNPVMIKKKARQELQQKSIYRSQKQPIFLRSSSSNSKNLINKTLISPEKFQKQQVQNNRVRSISQSMNIGHNDISCSKLAESINLNTGAKSRQQIQNYRLQMIDHNRKQKIQTYDFPNLLQNQAVSNYFNQSFYPSYLPNNPSIYFQNYTASKPAKGSSSNIPINALFENRSFTYLQD